MGIFSICYQRLLAQLSRMFGVSSNIIIVKLKQFISYGQLNAVYFIL